MSQLSIADKIKRANKAFAIKSVSESAHTISAATQNPVATSSDRLTREVKRTRTESPYRGKLKCYTRDT